MYYGKSPDGFEYALNCLLRFYHGVAVPYLDCLSYRAFAFRFGENLSKWFSPLIPWQEYLPTLRLNLRDSTAFSFAPCSEGFPIPQGQWFLLGELLPELYVETVQSRFYRGTHGFLLCCISGKNKVLISDPLGYPYQTMNRESLEHLCYVSGAFMLQLDHPIRIPALSDLRQSISNALSWRKTATAAKPESYVPDFTQLDRKSEISLRYGIMNAQIQMTKVFRFACDVHAGSPEQLLELQHIIQQFALIGIKLPWSSLTALETSFWSVVEQMEV